MSYSVKSYRDTETALNISKLSWVYYLFKTRGDSIPVQFNFSLIMFQSLAGRCTWSQHYLVDLESVRQECSGARIPQRKECGRLAKCCLKKTQVEALKTVFTF